jgi:arginyl-tRNA synthetase
MADPREVLAQRVKDALAQAFGPEYADADPLIRPSQFADFQANVALPLAKRLGRPPREVATELAGHLDLTSVAGPPEVSGPGFINITLHSDWIAAQAGTQLSDPRLGVPVASPALKAVVDYSAPNVAKEMHVGHLRTTVVGDAIVRILEHLGHTVVRANHLGDWGTPFGMLIEHLLDIGEAAAREQLTAGEITPFYQAARVTFDSDPAFAERARRRVVALQGGDAETLRLWQVLVDDSKQYYNTIYRRLGVTLTDADLAPESFYNPMLASDGGYGYDATDLAAIRYRIKDLHAGRLIYVVAAEQSLHFQMLFAVARQAGWLTDAVRAEHAVIGLVTGADGKRIRTRTGQPVKLITLIDEAVERAAKVIADRYDDPVQRDEIADAVGIGALKYGDLSVARDSSYAFDFDRMLALTGNTGPYLQYATARIRSIFRKAGLEPSETTGSIQLTEEAERALALVMLGFGSAVGQAAEAAEPHVLAAFLFDVASAFTTFYEQCPVLQAPTDSIRESRLALSALALRVLSTGLSLLGVPMPQRM